MKTGEDKELIRNFIVFVGLAFLTLIIALIIGLQKNFYIGGGIDNATEYYTSGKQLAIKPDKELINYKNTNNDKDKLFFAYRAEELLRIEHNEYGKKYKNKEISQEEWDNYINNIFMPKSIKISGEIARLRDKMNMYSTSTEWKINDEEEKKNALSDNKFDTEINLSEIIK